MPTFCYTHEGFVLFLNELKVQLNKSAIKLLAWLMVALLKKTRAHLFTGRKAESEILRGPYTSISPK